MFAEPRPTRRAARSKDPWRCSLDRIRMGGAPASPCSSTFHPRFCKRAWRAAARQVTCAIWQPVTNAKLAVGGKRRISFSQSPAISSTIAADGLHAASAAFWSQAADSQSAARADGSPPPTKHPAEKSWARRSDDSGLGVAREIGDYLVQAGGLRHLEARLSRSCEDWSGPRQPDVDRGAFEMKSTASRARYFESRPDENPYVIMDLSRPWSALAGIRTRLIGEGFDGRYPRGAMRRRHQDTRPEKPHR